MNEAYKRQVKLLLDVLPEIAKEDSFAMHGGTAINLFLQDMPRLSVDIDLTYVGLEVRAEALAAINAALLRIKDRVDKLRVTIRAQHKSNTTCSVRCRWCHWVSFTVGKSVLRWIDSIRETFLTRNCC